MTRMQGSKPMSRLADEARQNRAEEVGVTAFRDTAVMALRVMDYARAEAALAEGLAYADSIQQSHCAHVMAALTSETAWAAGQWDAAIPAGAQAMADRGCQRAPNMARWPLGYVAFGRGEFGRARDLLRDALVFGDQSEMISWRLPPMWGLAETDSAGRRHARGDGSLRVGARAVYRDRRTSPVGPVRRDRRPGVPQRRSTR